MSQLPGTDNLPAGVTRGRCYAVRFSGRGKYPAQVVPITKPSQIAYYQGFDPGQVTPLYEYFVSGQSRPLRSLELASKAAQQSTQKVH
jgi:hypothetical protein